MTAKKWVYPFGEVPELEADLDGSWEAVRSLLGGKGANLAEMTNKRIPVPPGFTITTEVCNYYYNNDLNLPEDLDVQVNDALKQTEAILVKGFGELDNPLLFAVRSGARQSMPGMMETVLNIGLTSKTIPGLITKTGNKRFVYDTYRRLIMMYADVVIEKAAGIGPKDGKGIRHQLEEILDSYKEKKGCSQDVDLSGDDWETVSDKFKIRIKDQLDEEFPDDPYDQLWGGIKAVFNSWNGKRAINYRRYENIPDEWGTAVSVQAMVFGNTSKNSATGVAFTRNPATGENNFYGEWLQNAQGEDVVAGIRTPNPLNESTKTDDNKDVLSLELFLPEVYKQLTGIRTKLEQHYTDMQDIEFTIEEERLWILQTRTGKRNGPAAIKIAVDMVKEGLIDKEEAIMRVSPDQIDELLHPMVSPEEEINAPLLAKGLPASPGGAAGQIVFTADDAEVWGKNGKTVILLRDETSPEDIHGMRHAAGILTAKGGMTSHAALVARGWGKCCIVGCDALQISSDDKTLVVSGTKLKEGDWITLNGTAGKVYNKKLELLEVNPFTLLESNQEYTELMTWVDEVRTLKVRTNAERPEDSALARSFGAQGIGLCRTEHMFFDPNRILTVRKMILATNERERRSAIMELLPFQRKDFKGILDAMHDLPVTIRLLDLPLHEFMPQTDGQINELAAELKISPDEIRTRINTLHEFNPMLGHRGCRLGITYPEITEMQSRAIFEATAELTKEGKSVFPEVMVPLIGTYTEFENQEAIVRQIADSVMEETGIKFDCLVGTMIELPRAALTADEIAKKAEFFSFGTNDLTQTTYGFSRDDIGKFLPDYLEQKVLAHDPFQSLDQSGVGQLVKMGVDKGRSIRENLQIGICGEHGGDADSIDFCHQVGLDYVSCSPFRIPVARLAAAHSALRHQPAE